MSSYRSAILRAISIYSLLCWIKSFKKIYWCWVECDLFFGKPSPLFGPKPIGWEAVDPNVVLADFFITTFEHFLYKVWILFLVSLMREYIRLCYSVRSPWNWCSSSSCLSSSLMSRYLMSLQMTTSISVLCSKNPSFSQISILLYSISLRSWYLAVLLSAIVP